MIRSAITRYSMFIREEPRPDADFLEYVPPGTELPILGQLWDEHGILWYEVEANGLGSGYCRDTHRGVRNVVVIEEKEDEG